MNAFNERIKKITSEYKKEEKRKQTRLESNKKEQEELRQRLAKLEEEETQLEEELAAGRSQDEEAERSKGNAVKNVGDWRERIVELQGRAETSLKVMKEMSGKGESGRREGWPIGYGSLVQM